MKTNRMMIKTVLAFLLVSGGMALWGGTLDHEKKGILDAWLRQHPHYRVATDEDCKCPDDIKLMRQGQGGAWQPIPDYHPYLVEGDFNSDGLEDFAVVVIDDSKTTKNFTLLVFNGPLRRGMKPAFELQGLDFNHHGLFYGPPRPKPYRLVIGSFESEGQILTPTDGGYKLVDDEP